MNLDKIGRLYMDYSFNDNQKMLRQTARDFLKNECPKAMVREMATNDRGYPQELWKKMAELGWLGLAIPERYGGLGGSFLDLVCLMEEMGRALLPSPFLPTVILGASTILELGSDRQKSELLAYIAGGEVVVTLALYEPHTYYSIDKILVHAEPDRKGYIIKGTKIFVPFAHVADYIICAANTSKGISLFLVNGNNDRLACTVLKTITKNKKCEVSFDGVYVSQESMLGNPGEGHLVLQKVLQKAAVAKCAEMIGGAQQVLEITTDYVKERKQFGVPIGSFQAIQHHCANMMVEMQTSKFLTYKAGWMLSEGKSCTKEIAIAKAWVSDAYRRITWLGHQCIGGVGVMKDHDLSLYSSQAKEDETAFGDADFYKEIVATELGL